MTTTDRPQIPLPIVKRCHACKRKRMRWVMCFGPIEGWECECGDRELMGNAYVRGQVWPLALAWLMEER